jgi:hypothetical protein
MRHSTQFVPASQPQTLIGFLKSIGGLRDNTELRLRDARVTWPGLVNNKRGRNLDHAREAAEEAGYLPAFSSVSDLLNAIDGHPTYRWQDQSQRAEWEAQRDKTRYAETDLDALAPRDDIANRAEIEFDELFSSSSSDAPRESELTDLVDDVRAAKALAWRKSMGLSRAKLAPLIGFAPSVIQDYEEGARRGKAGAHALITEDAWRRYAMACAALGAGITPLW